MASKNNYGDWLCAESVRLLGKLLVIKEEFEMQGSCRDESMEARDGNEEDDARGSSVGGGSQHSVSTKSQKSHLHADGSYALGSGKNVRGAQSSSDTSTRAHLVGSDDGRNKGKGIMDPGLGLMEVDSGFSKDRSKSVGPVGELTISPSKIRFRRGTKNGKACMLESGNSPYIVEIPSDEERESAKAIVVHGSNVKVSELALNLQDVCLKRKVLVPGSKARKRIGVEGESLICPSLNLQSCDDSPFGVGSGSPGKKTPRKRVQKLEVSLNNLNTSFGSLENAPTGSISKREDVSLVEYVFKVENDADNGGGGWPGTATRGS